MVPVPVTHTISDEGLKRAVCRACYKQIYHPYDRRGMRARTLFGQLNHKIMGTIAEISLKEYLIQIGIGSLLYDEVRINGFRETDPGWDIAIGDPSGLRMTKEGPQLPEAMYRSSIRSSILPRNKTISDAVSQYDFKIIGHPGKSLEEEMTADLEFQVYYENVAEPSGDITLDQIRRCMDNIDNCQEIIDMYDISGRYGTGYLTAWNSRQKILDYSATLPLDRRSWNSYGKLMWVAPLRFGRSIDALRELIRDSSR